METPRYDRTLDNIHQDIDFANRYRIEYIKHLMSLSGGIFILSIGLMGDSLSNVNFEQFREAIVLGWFTLILSMVGGIFHMRTWDKFYMSFRRPHEEGITLRKKLRKRRRVAEAIQVSCFLTGLMLIFAFVAINIL